jgi:PAS domain S-box-containing protein
MAVPQAEEKLRRLNRRLRALSSCNQILLRAVDEPTMLEAICRVIREEAGYRMVWVGYVEADGTKTIRPMAWAGIEATYIAEARLTWASTGLGGGAVGEVVRSGRTVCAQDLAAEADVVPWLEHGLQCGYRSSMVLPLKDEAAKTFGVLGIYCTEPHAFNEEEQRLLEELAGDLAFGITVLHARIEGRRAEWMLEESEKRLRLTLEATHLGIWDWNVKTDQWYGSPTYYTMLGYEPRSGPGTRKEWLERVHPDDLRHVRGKIEAVLSGDFNEYCYEARLRHADGSYRWQQVRGFGIERDQDGSVTRMLGTRVDISERKAAEDALHESERKFRALAENSPDNIFRYDRDCRLLYANHQVKTTLSLADSLFLGKTPLELSPEGLFAGGLAEAENYQTILQGVIRSGEVADVEMRVQTSGGAFRVHSVRFAAERGGDGQIVGALAFGRDVTEMKKLVEQLGQSQKIEAVGQLAGGVAHDFNNILTAIIGFSNIAKMRMKPGDPQEPLIDQILAAADRAAHLTRSLLAFSRKQVLDPKPIDLNNVVRNIEKLLGRLIGEDVEFSAQLTGQCLIVMADAGQIEQVLMNLATNARDAMPAGGSLSITTEVKAIGEDYITTHGYGKAGQYALIVVSDTGHGMDAQTLGRVFEPFFTTKKPGKGTGLGLSMAYGIVKQHDGYINVYSEPGNGTTFRIYLPLITLAVEDAHPNTGTPPPGGTETLLLAEDDQVIRTLMAGVLTDYGYQVIEAVDGKDALDKITAQLRKIDLLILDVIMPKMSGKEVYDSVKAQGPSPKALFISGYTADSLNRRGIFEEGVHFIAKPVSPSELLHKIRSILDEAR